MTDDKRMTPERWERAQSIFFAARELPQGERESFLVSECTDDPQLLQEVRSLLAHACDTNDATLMDQRSPGAKLRRALGEALVVDLAADASVTPPLPVAQSVILSAALDGLGDGIRLDALDGEPSVVELTQGSAKYAVHDVLGEGGMGRVYLARDADLQRCIALKTVLSAQPDLLERFVGEAQVMAQLCHPGIVPVHELGLTDKGMPFYTMPVVQGRTLEAVFNALRDGDESARKEWSLTRLVQLFLQVCRAVGYAHAKGVVHRDLKPASVMVGLHGEVQVLDWGVSMVVQDGSVRSDMAAAERSDAGVVLGTPAYMSPEQSSGELLDHRTDVYALGVILYECLTLRRPFLGSAAEVLAGVKRDRPPAPRHAAPGRGVPQALERACLKAMSKRPADRQGSAEELSAATQDWLDAETERKRRRELADVKAAEGKARLAEYRRLSGEIARLEEAVHAAAQGVKSWQPMKEKCALLEAERAVVDARKQLAESASAALTVLTAALGHDKEHAAAREALADYYWDRLKDAEARSEHRDVRFYERLVSSYHDGKYAKELSAFGSLVLESEPSGAEVWLHEYEQADGTLRLGKARLLGTTPLPKTALGVGSYLVVLKSSGHGDTRYPVYLRGGQDWEGRLRLLTDAEIGEDFVHVPAGPFIQGGDPKAGDSAARRSHPWVDDYLIGRHPVTQGEYLEYLNELVAREGLQAALARSPRTLVDSPESTFLVVASDDSLLLPEKDAAGDRWEPRWPVFGVSWADAVEYCAWRAERDGRTLRLATAREREKAARGVDGRLFAWGDRFDPALCNTERSRRDRPVPMSVDANPSDVSPYGVMGVTGNVADWTSTTVVVGEGSEARTLAVAQGGAWMYREDHSRPARRHVVPGPQVSAVIGFRLAASPFGSSEPDEVPPDDCVVRSGPPE